MKIILKYLLLFWLLLPGWSLSLHSLPPAINIPDQTINNSTEYLTQLKNQLRKYRDNGNNDSLIVCFLESEKHPFIHNPEIGVSIYLLAGDFFSTRKAYTQAINCRLKELRFHRLLKKSPLVLDHFFCLGGLGGLYQNIGNLNQSLLYYNQALAFAQRQHDPFMLLHAYNNLGVYYLKANSLKKAVVYFNKALAVSTKQEKREVNLMRGIIEGNMASALTSLGHCQDALGHFEENLKVSAKEKAIDDYARTAVGYAKALKCAEKLPRAIEVLLKTEKMADSCKLNEALVLIYQEIFTSFLAAGNLKGARDYWEKYSQAYTRQTNKEKREYTLALESLANQQLALAEADKTNQELAVNLTNSRMQRTLFIMAILILVAITTILVVQRRSREMARQAAMEKVQRELLAVELKNKELLQQKTDFELKASKKDVTNLAIDLNQHEEIRKSLVKSLKEVQKASANSETGEMVNKIITDVNKQLHNGQSRAIFNENISKVNHAFFENLSIRYPSLSKSELEFCGLLRLKLSSKEISTVKSITPDSAKVIRHRIRKKLGIGPEVDIYRILEEV